MCITEYNEAETMEMFREEGEDRLGQLVSVLISKGRSEDVQRAATNKEARKRLYEEFNMNETVSIPQLSWGNNRCKWR